MSLLLNGSKTLNVAGTEMQCIEIYTGESYTLPLAFTYANSQPINCTSWTLTTTVKYYTADTITYNDEQETIILGNLTPSANSYTGGNLTASFTNAASGIGYLYIPSNLTGNTGGGPVVNYANNSANSVLAVITLGVTRTDALSSKVDFNKEPIGVIVRYQ
jgi:hypothetical protein